MDGSGMDGDDASGRPVRGSGPLDGIMDGGLLLMCCAVMYLIWWTVFFRPGADVQPMTLTHSLGVAALISSAVSGVTGVWRLVECANALMKAKRIAWGAAPLWCLFAALFGHIITAFLTNMLLERPVTTELAIIAGYAGLTAAILIALGRSSSMPARTVTTFAVALALMLVIDIACYAVWYLLPQPWAFIDGAVPLVLAGMYSFAISAAARRVSRKAQDRRR